MCQNTTTTTKAGKQTEVLVPGYKQYSMEEKNRVEVPINYLPLASGTDAIPGRFNLYATQNMWTFILLDEVDGRTWQVQWSTDGKEGIVPINAGSTL